MKVAPVGTIADATSTVLATGNTADTSTVTLPSTAYTGVTGSPVTVQSSTIRYYKTSDSPSTAPATLTDQPGPAGQIPSGSSLAFTFTTASVLFKNNLVSNSGFVPGVSVWRYTVEYFFTLKEDFTNTTVTSIVNGGTITFQ